MTGAAAETPALARGYMPVSQKDDWETPKALFDALERRYGAFTLDPCGQREHHYSAFTIHHSGGLFYDGSCDALDGLVQPWSGRVFVNPPYGATKEWMGRGLGERERTDLLIYLIAARTDTKAFHDLIWPNATEVLFLKGRVHFVGSGSGPAPFASMVVAFERDPNPNRSPSVECWDWRERAPMFEAAP